ncbi:hypothetical protein IEO21_03658 [Rhodonia placenta]|uniref:Uncharacterized protein n=1 Tax=Rhodonia placenta TaxID=104341 RepID=A0A8H7P5M8_9APHY|nr:hypothetical protein IEO21_03658 [Postia placenta]
MQSVRDQDPRRNKMC